MLLLDLSNLRSTVQVESSTMMLCNSFPEMEKEDAACAILRDVAAIATFRSLARVPGSGLSVLWAV